MILFIMLASQVAVVDPAATTPSSPSSSITISPMEQAEANRKLMRRPPEAITNIDPNFLTEEQSAGHGGVVKLSAIIDINGKASSISIKLSSAPPSLEKEAIAALAAARFAPARDAQRNPIAVVIVISLVFESEFISSRYVKFIAADYGDAERGAGHHGTVTIAGEIGGDGHILNARIAKTSHSLVLDNAALKAVRATTYRSFHDGAGKPVTTPVEVPYEFVSYQSPGKNPDIARYTCAQFLKDEAWAQSVNRDQFEVAARTSRILTEALLYKNPKAKLKDFANRWGHGIAICKIHPEKLLVDVF